jgi:hypothetical protein
MDPAAVGGVAFACTLGGALGGLALRGILPARYFDEDARDTVKLGVGLIATMTALILGLVTASAKSAFDAADAAVKHVAADALSLDRALARYGPETAAHRATLRRGVTERVEAIWRRPGAQPLRLGGAGTAQPVEHLAAQVSALVPRTDEQRWLQARALDLIESTLERRWLVIAGLGTSIPGPFLVMLMFWLTVTFGSFGLFAPRNPMVMVVLGLCALSVAGAVFLILELDGPFDGLVVVSPDPLRYALSHLGE